MQNLMPPVDTPDNLFHDGDPTQGIEGTIVEAEWMNNSQGATRDVQQEIINVLLAAGINPDPANQSQLLQALQLMISGDIDGVLDAALLIANNLSEIAANGAAAQGLARDNLALGTAATHNAEDFMSAGYQPPSTDLSGYYTKTESDGRFEPIDSAWTKAESDARYLSQSSGAVSDVQLGAEYTKDYGGGSAVKANAGSTLIGLREEQDDNEIHTYYFKPIQKLVNGVWVTIGG